MSKLTWDSIGEHFFETGVDRGVLFPFKNSAYQTGVAWNGLTAVNEKPSGAEPTPLYADNIKYLNLMSREEFEATIEAFTYPDEFAECDGSAEVATGVMIGQQKRIPFGFAYRTKLGNDTDGADYGYKLHIVYGAMAKVSEKSHATINETPEAMTFSWDITTTPVPVPDHEPTASITIDSTKADADDLKDLENILYGVDADAAHNIEASTPRLPLPEEILSIFGVSVLGG